MMRVELHPLPLRIWHWLNAMIVVGLIATGFYMRLQGVAALKSHDHFLLAHKWLGVSMILSTIFWLVYTLTGNRTRHLKIGIKDLMGISAQAKYYLIYIFGGGENPFRASADNKYNPLQKIAYNAVMFILLPVQALTVFAFTDIPALRHSVHSADLIALLGAIHILIMYLLVLYLIFHLYMATLGETFFSHTKAMIKGYEEHHQEIEREPT